MKRNKIMTTIYLTPEQAEALERLSSKTRVKKSDYIREGIDSVLKRYKNILIEKK